MAHTRGNPSRSGAIDVPARRDRRGNQRQVGGGLTDACGAGRYSRGESWSRNNRRQHPLAPSCRRRMAAGSSRNLWRACRAGRPDPGGSDRGQGPHRELSLSQRVERRGPPDFRNTEYRCAPYDDYFFLRQGRKVFEILPRVQWDKGSAVLRILERLRETHSVEIALCYIGDDTTDECAFRQLPAAITVRVGESQPTAARFHLAGDEEVSKFLNWISTATDLIRRR